MVLLYRSTFFATRDVENARRGTANAHRAEERGERGQPRHAAPPRCAHRQRVTGHARLDVRWLRRVRAPSWIAIVSTECAGREPDTAERGSLRNSESGGARSVSDALRPHPLSPLSPSPGTPAKCTND